VALLKSCLPKIPLPSTFTIQDCDRADIIEAALPHL